MLRQNIEVTQDKKLVNPAIHVVQGDTGRTVVALVKDATISGTATMAFERPDGATYTTTATVNSDSSVEATFTADMLRVAGTGKATFKVVSSGSQVSTYQLYVLVESSAGFERPVTPSNNKIYVYVNGNPVEVATAAEVATKASQSQVDGISATVNNLVGRIVEDESNIAINTATLSNITPKVTKNESDISELKDEFDSAFVVIDSPNLINPAKINFDGNFLDLSGALHQDTWFCRYEFNVSQGQVFGFFMQENIANPDGEGDHTIKPFPIRFITAYDSSNNAIPAKGAENLSYYTVPAGITKLIISANNYRYHVVENKWMALHSTSTPTEVIEYKKIYNLSDDTLKSVRDALIGEPSRYISLSGNLAPSQALVISNNNVKCGKHLAFFAKLNGAFNRLLVGHGYSQYESSYLEITTTEVVAYEYLNARIEKGRWSHGLTFTNDIAVYIDVDTSLDVKATVRVYSNGSWFEITINSWSGANGNIYAEPSGCSLNDCRLSWTADGYWEDIQMYGDSYFGIVNDNRWLHYLVKDGFGKHLLLDSYAGRTSAVALNSFKLNIQHSKPKYAVWCMGMNDNDSATAINASYKSATEEFVKICEDNDIIPILATIPSAIGGMVPDSSIRDMRINKFKNAYVRNSGKRYIDFDKSVGANENSGEWYPGLLSADGVHPTEKGAKALYFRACVDFPELMRN